MAKTKDNSTPLTTMEQYDFMAPAWEKIQTVLDGTRALRDAGQSYLPQHSKEADSVYRERLERAVLMNLTKITLDSWVGRPFSEPIELKEDVPPEIKDLSENIDTLGSHINVFARNVFREGLAKAYTHVLVDMPRLGSPEDGSPRTLADDRDEGVRPYWVHIKPEQLFFAESAIVDGNETLLEIRFLESITTREGFAIVTKEVVKQMVLTGGAVEVAVWEEKKTGSSKKTEWVIIDQYMMEINQIPLVTFYADRDSFMLGKSPIEDLVDLNIAHWQSGSDQRAVLTVARFPMLAVSGGTDEDKSLVVGPNRWLYCPDPTGKFYYVEHTGKAIEAGLKDMLELTRQMGEYGAEFLKKRPGRETATARTLDSAEASSALQDVTLRFKDFMENCLALTAKWLDLENGGSINVNSDFGTAPISGEGLRILMEARTNRDISREAFVAELKRAKILDEDFDPDGDVLALEEEVMNMLPVPLPKNDGTNEPMNDIKDEDGNE